MSGELRYAMVVRREADRCEPLNGPDADLFSIIHWGTELRARGKVVAGAVVDVDSEAAVPDAFLILKVESATEAKEIARSWPVREGARVDLIRVVGNF